MAEAEHGLPDRDDRTSRDARLDRPKETGKASERPMIAGVYCNRLRIGMKLDADPTIIYPVTKGKPLRAQDPALRA